MMDLISDHDGTGYPPPEALHRQKDYPHVHGYIDKRTGMPNKMEAYFDVGS
jgi:hypothetical protein